MSELGKEQGQLKALPSAPTDNFQNDYNAETKINEICTNYKTEKTNPSRRIFIYKKLQQFMFKMYFIFKEFAVMLFLAFTYAALTNNPPKVSKSPVAFPFFPKNSLVTDWYRGELTIALDRSRMSDITFIMFYAPWNAECQAMRQELDLAAKYMKKQVNFTAINCWQPDSECRNRYKKTYIWPVLVAYFPRGRGIQYNGLRNAAHITKFLMVLSRPILRLSHKSEAHVLLASYDAVVVGFVNALPGSLEYAVFYTVALRFLEKDPLQEIAFAVITGPKQAAAPSLALYTWNETLWYPHNMKWNTESLLTWISKNLYQVSIWVMPTGRKSLTLSMYVQPGPTLLLFTPRNPLEPFLDYYDLLHEVGLEYYNCGQRNRILYNSMLINSKRIDNYLNYTFLKKSCESKMKTDKQSVFPSVVTYSVPRRINNSYCFSTTKLGSDKHLKCNRVDFLKEQISTQCQQFDTENECLNLYNPNLRKDNYRNCGGGVLHTKDYVDIRTSLLYDENDSKLPKNLQKLWEEEKCRIADISQKVHPIVFSESVRLTKDASNQVAWANISGFACKTNASLTFIALDTLHYYQFAERLGVDVLSRKDKTVAFIINEKVETHHIIHGSVNDKSLREFIFNFSINSLPRAYNSVVLTKKVHTYPHTFKKTCQSSKLCLLELNTKTFLPTVMQQGKAVMVLYYSKQCSFCTGISYTFLTVAKLFNSMDSIIFTRIDGDLNALPWEFTMDRYPTVIFFPTKRKSESRVFPQTVPLTVSNLVAFILTNLDSTLKLRAMWTICIQTKYKDEKELCMASLRAENLSIIEHTLRMWRNSDLLTRTKLLHRLQQLRSLNLLLAHLPQNAGDIHKHMMKLEALSLKGVDQIDKALENRTLYVKKET